MRWLRPIPQDWIPWHLLLFILLCAIGLASRAAEQLPMHMRGDPIGFTNAMVDRAVSVILVAATISTTIVEGALIFAEKYLKHRFERGLEQGREEGREEGREVGREEGAGEERRRWKEWNDRRTAAELAGEEFTDPAPTEDGHPKEPTRN